MHKVDIAQPNYLIFNILILSKCLITYTSGFETCVKTYGTGVMLVTNLKLPSLWLLDPLEKQVLIFFRYESQKYRQDLSQAIFQISRNLNKL